MRIEHRGEHRFTMLTPALHYRHHAASKCTFGTQVIVRAPDGVIVAHHVRVWGEHQTLTDPTHAATAKQMRHQLAVTRIHPQAVEVEQADLNVYDRLAGLEVGA